MSTQPEETRKTIELLSRKTGILNQAIRRPQPETPFQDQIDKTIAKATIEGKAKNTITLILTCTHTQRAH